MNGKKTLVSKRTTVPLVKSRSVSSLRPKTDSSSETGKVSTLNKNSPAVLRASSANLHTVSKSAGKDRKSKSAINHNEPGGDLHLDEGKLDIIDDAYTAYMQSTAMQVLLEKSKHKIRGDIDKQISALQRRVNDSLDALEKTRSNLNTLCLLQEQTNMLSHHSQACNTLSNEPAFTKEKSFGELMMEINRIKNQLPCKNIYIPETNTELANFQDTTSRLLHSMELISTSYGAHQSPISQTATQLDNIKATREAVENAKFSAEAFSHKASCSILNKVIQKTAELRVSDIEEK